MAAIEAKKKAKTLRTPAEVLATRDIVTPKVDRDVLDITTNQDNPLSTYPKKSFKLWVVKHPEGSEKVPGSETIVRSQHYGQAVDDFIIDWNNRKRNGKTIGYPVVQGKPL